MTKKENNSWELRTSRRYIRDNMEKAMRGNIQRGLVELITNSVDSYRDIIDKNKHVKCKIRIEIKRCKGDRDSIITVRDRACGMNREEMQRKLGGFGLRTSGFEIGKARRGLHGRGAKDVVAFGDVHFESIKDNYYNCLTISNSIMCKFKNLKPTKVNNKIRNVLNIKGNGTVVTMFVKSRFSIPQHETLRTIFSRYYSMRDIFSDNRFDITLVDLNNNRADQLIYKYPEGVAVFDEDIEIPDYPEAITHLKIIKHSIPFDHNTQSEYREGILIKSPSAIHQCVHFQLESDPFAHRFTGELYCAYIDKLVREYDDLEEENPENPKIRPNNPIRLLNSDRDGLILEHPFAINLFKAGKKILQKHIDKVRKEEKKKEKDVSNKNLDDKLSKLSKEISKIFESKINEMEDEIIPNEDSQSISDYSIGLHIVPPEEQIIYLNKPKTFSIIIKNYEELDESIPIELTTSNPQELCINRESLSIKKFSENKKIGRSTFQVTGKRLGAEGIIQVRYNGFDNVVLLRVTECPQEDLPENLSFEKVKFVLPLNKSKSLIVRLNNSEETRDNVHLKVISSNPDIIVLNGGSIILKKLKSNEIYKGRCFVQGRKLHAKGKLIVHSDDYQDVEVEVVVRERENKKSGINLKFVPVEENFGSLRYMWDPKDTYKLLIGAMHHSIRPYLGRLENDKYPGIDSKEYHLILAEIISEALAFNILEKKFKTEGLNNCLDFASTDLFYHKEASEFLQVAHNILGIN